MKDLSRNKVNEAVWSKASSPEPTRVNISGTIVNTHITYPKQAGIGFSILPLKIWKHFQGGSGRIDIPMPTVFDTLPLSPSLVEVAARRPQRDHLVQIQSGQEYTTQGMARDGVNEWEIIRPLLERVLSLVEKGLNKEEGIIETAIETLKKGEYDSRTTLTEMKVVVESNHLSLQVIRTPLEESQEIIRHIRSAITTLNNIISLSGNDTAWVMKSAEDRLNTRRHLQDFEVQVKSSHVQFDALRLAFLEKYAEEVTTELSDLRYAFSSQHECSNHSLVSDPG